jgi:hypothetical protein
MQGHRLRPAVRRKTRGADGEHAAAANRAELLQTAPSRSERTPLTCGRSRLCWSRAQRPRSHRRGHWLDPSIAHQRFCRLSAHHRGIGNGRFTLCSLVREQIGSTRSFTSSVVDGPTAGIDTGSHDARRCGRAGRVVWAVTRPARRPHRRRRCRSMTSTGWPPRDVEGRRRGIGAWQG